MDLSIVIVSWNTRALLAQCLTSLPAAVAGTTCEILVADNASRDGTADLLRREFQDVRLLETGGNLGFARASNLGLAAARGERLLLLNPDTICPAGSLTELCAKLDRLPDAAAVGPRLVDADGRPTASWGDFPALWHHWRCLVDPALRWLPRRWREPGLGRTAESARYLRAAPDPVTGAVPVPYVKGACLLMARAAWASVGPLDERFFMYFEETDWCRRAHAIGRRIYLCPDVSVVHLEGRTTALVSAFSLRQFQHSYRLYLAKHEGAAAVRRLRRALRWEYRWKAWLRRRLPAPSAGSLADQHAAIAALQLEDDLAPAPPARP